ncbi:MAG: acetamidase/formamidase family protein, partial [candidate division NC10 bacterium]|nr:acetamidase/formamidase family protein [candidate division NC10 bacterium]
MEEKKMKTADKKINRRTFLKYSAALGGAATIGGFTFKTAKALDLKRMEATGKIHILGNNPTTSTDGYWDNSVKPALYMNSGDIVHVETGTHLMNKMIPGAEIEDWMNWYKEAIDRNPEVYIYPDKKTGAEKLKRGAAHHNLTGPIYVNGADPGDILQVEILDIVPIAYGFNLNPETSFMKLGLLPEDFPKGKVRWYYVDLKNMKFEFLPGIEI